MQHFSVLALGGATWTEQRGKIKEAEDWGKVPGKTTEIPPQEGNLRTTEILLRQQSKTDETRALVFVGIQTGLEHLWLESWPTQWTFPVP